MSTNAPVKSKCVGSKTTTTVVAIRPPLGHDHDTVHISRTGDPEIVRIFILGPRGGFKGFAYAKADDLVAALIVLEVMPKEVTCPNPTGL